MSFPTDESIIKSMFYQFKDKVVLGWDKYVVTVVDANNTYRFELSKSNRETLLDNVIYYFITNFKFDWLKVNNATDFIAASDKQYITDRLIHLMRVHSVSLANARFFGRTKVDNTPFDIFKSDKRFTDSAKELIDAMYHKNEIISMFEEEDHDGYDSDGPLSNLYDLYIIHNKNNIITVDWYHWEDWFTSGPKGYIETLKYYDDDY